MRNIKPVVARSVRELAKELGLSPVDGMEIEFRSEPNDKIIEVVSKKGLTHADVARPAHTRNVPSIQSIFLTERYTSRPTRLFGRKSLRVRYTLFTGVRLSMNAV